MNAWAADQTPAWTGLHAFGVGLAISAGQGITMPDAGWIGRGAGIERIEFYTAGYVVVMGADFGLGTPTPADLLHLWRNNVTNPIVTLERDTYVKQYVWGANDLLGLDSNRHPSTGVFDDVNKTHVAIRLRVAAADGSIRFFTAAANNVHGTERMRIDKNGYRGLGTTSPDRLDHAEASDAVTAAVTYAQRLTHVTSGTALAGFGVGIEFELETATSQDVMGRLFVKLADATHATRRATFGIDLNRQGSFQEAIRIVAADVAPLAGNARGAGSVDLQQYRTAATQVASGVCAVISGGRENYASSDYATVAGGQFNQAITNDGATISGGWYNIASGKFSAIPGGYYGKADKYGQICSASGSNSNQGTIQFVVWDGVTHSDASWYELYLDGAGERMTIAEDTAWTFDALIVGVSQGCAKVFGFRIEGTIENDGGTTTLLASTVTTIYDTDDVSFDARASADNANDALLIEVQDSGSGGDTVYWTCTVRTAEATYLVM